MRAVLILFLIAACGGCRGQSAPATSDSPPARAELAAGWNAIAPGGDTTCALGTEFRFFARAGAADRLVVYLQGGGACWKGANCDPKSEPTYAPDVDETDNPANRPTGIFDLDNPANPVAGYSMVMVPYCTGDVHLGDRVATYAVAPEGSEPYEVTIRHNGYANVMAALAWVESNLAAPAEILVAGSSAGSLPAPFYGQILAERYPRARVTVLGDAAGGYRRTEQTDNVFAEWGTLAVLQRHPGYDRITDADITFADLFIVAGRQQPRIRLHQFDTAHDGVVEFFLRLGGEKEAGVAALLKENRDAIRDAVPGFRGYTAGGYEHTILTRSALYQYEVRGVLFRDWLAAVVSGAPADDVECTGCRRAELHYGKNDARIIERAAALLADESSWNRSETDCPTATGPLGLPCALERATRDVTGANGWSAARLDTVAEAYSRIPDLNARAPLRDFNNREATSLADVKALLAAVATRIASHRHGDHEQSVP